MVSVLIIAGSKTDEAVVSKATSVLDDLGITYQVEYASAHREPDKVRSIIEATDAQVIIAIAGLSAALPGFVAAYTSRPVIGVPVSAALGGLDALLSIAQMPRGVPVATVGIDNGYNAAHLAARILGIDTRRRQAPQPTQPPSVTTPLPSTYSEAGVDYDLVARGLAAMARHVRASFQSSGLPVLQDFGHYANTVKISDEYAIALHTDGVGTKVLIAQASSRYDTIGIDCVAMNVNDVICVGATPIGFVDYLAVQRPLPEAVMDQLGKGILAGCKEAGVPILGGETAVLPEIIRGGDNIAFDLAGTAMGLVRTSELIDGRRVVPGDVIIGIASNGLHANGYTLARKVLLAHNKLTDDVPWGGTLLDELLRPTRIYVKHFKALRDAGIDVHGIAHITGQGFRKILRLGTARYNIKSLPDPPPIFDMILHEGKISWAEMFRTFNMGIGLVVIVPATQKTKALDVLNRLDNAYELGKVEAADTASIVIGPFGVVIQ